MGKMFVVLLAARLAAATISIDAGAPSDQYFTGGKNDFTITYPGVTGDVSVRYGAFKYHIPAPAGAYLVTLYFRETGTVTARNQRVFSVKLNGQTILDKFDLFAGYGLAVYAPSFPVGTVNGFIDLDFSYTVKSAIVSAIQVDVIGEVSMAYPEGFAFSRKVDEPQAAGAQCQPGDYAEGGGQASTTLGVPLYVCSGGTLRRYRSDPEPWGNAAVSDLGGVLQIKAAPAGQETSPPVFYFRTFDGGMIGPFEFRGPGPLPSGLQTPSFIQPFPRAAAQ